MRAGALRAVLAGAVVATAPRLAEAHLAGTRFGDFYGGALHLATALEHALPLLALGLLAGLQQREAGRWVLVAAPLGLLAGAALAVLIPGVAPAPWLDRVSLALFGLLAAAAWRLSPMVLAGLGLAFGLLHGYENGMAMTADVTVHLFILGVGTAGFVLIAPVTATAAALIGRAKWAPIAIRALGSWFAALGVMMMGFALA